MTHGEVVNARARARSDLLRLRDDLRRAEKERWERRAEELKKAIARQEERAAALEVLEKQGCGI